MYLPDVVHGFLVVASLSGRTGEDIVTSEVADRGEVLPWSTQGD